MDKKEKCECCGDMHKKWWGKPLSGGGDGGSIYCLGIIGALFYFLSHANNFQTVVLGILKAVVWPALFVFKALELLKF